MRDVCKRYGITLGKLWDRVRVKGLKRDDPVEGAKLGKPAAAASSEANLPMIADSVVAEIVNEAVEQAVDDIVKSHKGITRKLRERLDAEMAEFEESCKYLATFRDEAHIAKLAAKNDDGKAVREYLNQCNAHHKARADTLERLSRIGSQVVTLEQGVWRLNDPDAVTDDSYVALLQEIRDNPYKPAMIHDNVLNFEQRLKGMRNGR